MLYYIEAYVKNTNEYVLEQLVENIADSIIGKYAKLITVRYVNRDYVSFTISSLHDSITITNMVALYFEALTKLYKITVTNISRQEKYIYRNGVTKKYILSNHFLNEVESLGYIAYSRQYIAIENLDLKTILKNLRKICRDNSLECTIPNSITCKLNSVKILFKENMKVYKTIYTCESVDEYKKLLNTILYMKALGITGTQEKTLVKIIWIKRQKA
ncbi:MAG: hypothetical protein DRO40_06795 [Thermoprotei archaeon]|nr:MAG: hypothetical protein DRO40_06795 [Thermoprotei archaeon]